MEIKNVWERFKMEEKWIGRAVLFTVIFSAIFWIFASAFDRDDASNQLASQEGYSEERSDENEKPCTVLGLNLHGRIYTYIPERSGDDEDDYEDYISSETIMGYISAANDDKDIRAIILEVDSLGGYPVAGEEIARAIEESEKPVIGLIRQSGASAAYWAVSAADKIYASANSDIGGIGVTASYSENLDPEKRFVQLSSGKYKDAFNPDKVITDDERRLMMRDLNIIHENFIQAVAKHRDIPIERVRSIADGSTILGGEAKRIGLIDEIGNLYDVRDYLRKELGDDLNICWE